ncbi:MAG: hypothetical protein CTY28_09625 [Hyphomicrobium sp.]|nr:MAG: hypothetical protein CTY28_09625 [Hyphomicrobium sp.]
MREPAELNFERDHPDYIAADDEKVIYYFESLTLLDDARHRLARVEALCDWMRAPDDVRAALVVLYECTPDDVAAAEQWEKAESARRATWRGQTWLATAKRVVAARYAELNKESV